MTGMLSLGSRGADVKELQRRLNLCITTPPPLVEDGIFGPLTGSRVVAFHIATALRADGIVGPHTEKTLILSTPDEPSPAEDAILYGTWYQTRARDIFNRYRIDNLV